MTIKNGKMRDYGAKKGKYVKLPEIYAGIIEYKMSKVMADNILKEHKNNSDPQTLLCNYVNTQLGLKGHCVKVHVEVE